MSNLALGALLPQVILMPNGCMCCRVRGDLVAALQRLIMGTAGVTTTEEASNSPIGVFNGREGVSTADKADKATSNNDHDQGGAGTTGQTPLPSMQKATKLDGVIIECSGLDELAPVLQVDVAGP